MLHPDDPHYIKLREWQARNRRNLYIGGGAFAFALLIANLIQIVRGWK